MSDGGLLYLFVESWIYASRIVEQMLSGKQFNSDLHADKLFEIFYVRGRIVIRCSDTDVLFLFVHYFPQIQHTEELWLCMETVFDGKDISQFTICVTRFLISHVRFYPSL